MYFNPSQSLFFVLFELLHPWPKGTVSIDIFCVSITKKPWTLIALLWSLTRYPGLILYISNSGPGIHYFFWEPLFILMGNAFPINLVTRVLFLLLILSFSVVKKWNTFLLEIYFKREKFCFYKYFQFKLMLTDSISKDCFFSFELSLCEILTYFQSQTYQTSCIDRYSFDFCPFLLLSTSLFRRPLLLVLGLCFHCCFLTI